MTPVQIVGRRSSHFTRLTLMFAEELGVAYELAPIYDMQETSSLAYAGNPALKLPILRRDGSVVFGAQNICRALAETAPTGKRIVWPEDLRDDVSRNAQELVWHAMAAQVQWVVGTMIGKLPADNIYFAKGRVGFEGALQWLDEHASQALDLLPPRDLSVFEASLFCLIEHLKFRRTLPTDPYPALLRFAAEFGERPSAQRTPYAFDTPPQPAA